MISAGLLSEVMLALILLIFVDLWLDAGIMDHQYVLLSILSIKIVFSRHVIKFI